MVIFNDLLQNHSVALFGWAIFHDPGQSRNTICPGYSYQNQWYNRSLKLTSPEREVVGSSLQSSLQLCRKIKKKKKMERGMGDLFARLRKQKPPDKTKQKVESKAPTLQQATGKADASALHNLHGVFGLGRSLRLLLPPVLRSHLFLCERTEYDLDKPNHAVEWILSAFAPSKREELKILAELYVSQLKGSSKNLADIFYKKVISSGVTCGLRNGSCV